MTTWVERGAAQLASWTVGDGPGLVALHAGVTDSRAWRDCQQTSVDAGRQVVTFDRDPATFVAAVEDVLAVRLAARS